MSRQKPEKQIYKKENLLLGILWTKFKGIFTNTVTFAVVNTDLNKPIAKENHNFFFLIRSIKDTTKGSKTNWKKEVDHFFLN